MSIDKTKLDLFRKHAPVLQAVIDVAEMLEGLGSIEQAESESRNRLEKLRENEDDMSARAESLRSEIAVLTGAKAEHLSRIDGLLLSAERSSQIAIDAAVKRGKEIVVEAQGSASAIISDAERRSSDIDEKSQDARLVLTGLLSDIASARSELSSVNNDIEKLKSKFS